MAKPAPQKPASPSGSARTPKRAEDRAQAKASRAERKDQRRERRQQLMEVFRLARSADKRLVPVLVAVLLGTWLVVGVLVSLLLGVVTGVVLGLLVSVAVTAATFGRLAQRAVYAQADGRPGAALGVLQALPRPWRHSQVPVAFTRDQDMVHRVVGRPGVVLVGEGSPRRVQALLDGERRKVQRVAADVPVYTVLVGDAEGAIPLRKLRAHLVKLPRNLKPPAVGAVETRLRALGNANQLPIPKGPMPRSAKAARRGR